MRLFKILRIFTHRESGITFLETVVALAILSAITVTFLTGLATTSKAAFIADEPGETTTKIITDAMIEDRGGKPSGVLVFIDRMEKAISGNMLARNHLEDQLGVTVASVVTIKEIIECNYNPEKYGKYYEEILKTLEK